MENLDRTDMLTAGTKGNVEPMMKMTIESTEQAWNKNVECQETLEKSGKSRVHNAADGNREPALWSECTHARRNWKKRTHRVERGRKEHGGVGKKHL